MAFMRRKIFKMKGVQWRDIRLCSEDGIQFVM